jgi:diguanylate cyclase (GGDEF)-like protein
MSSAQSLLFVTIAASVVMLFVLSSLYRSNVEGIRHWFVANATALGGFVLFAGRGVLPDVLTFELANLVYMVAISLMLVGFRRHLSRSVPVPSLLAAMGAAMAILVFFHYGVDVMAVRVATVSVFHSIVCLAMALAIRRAAAQAPARYPYRFTSNAALLLAAAHALRLVVSARELAHLPTVLDAASWNMFFFALGSLAMPMLTLGAVMMANAQLVAQATHAADHDHLTGASSRRAFFRFAEREHARVARTGTDLTVLLFDIDHFKRINDTFGHAAGDQVLVDIVRRTGSVIRQMDVCARVGGEEFAVLLPDAGAEMAARVAQRLRRALERPLAVGAAQAEVSYTVSIGIARLEPGESIGDLLMRADRALYAAKAAGRNTAVCALPGGGTFPVAA